MFPPQLKVLCFQKLRRKGRSEIFEVIHKFKKVCLKIVLRLHTIITMTKYGNVDDVSIKTIVWRIDDFFSLPVDGERCESPPFSFANESWYLGTYPNGKTSHNSVGHVGLYLFRDKSGPPIHLTVSLNFKTFDGNKDGEKKFTYVYEKEEGYGFHLFMKRSMLLERKAELAPTNSLTVVCTVEHDSKSPDNSSKCSHCKESFDNKFVSSHELKCLDKNVKCPSCKDTVLLRDWFDNESEMARVKATEKLINDLGDLFKSGEHSDVIINVKDKEFHLHKNILDGRNPSFSSTIQTEMKENSTGIVTIDDCDVDVFRIYALFIYTGKADEMTVGNVCDLYEVADKYQEDQLKHECFCFMKAKLSVESFCDFIALALNSDDNELLQYTTDFFCSQIKDIIQNVKWQTFMIKYPTQANELHIKALDSNKAKCPNCKEPSNDKCVPSPELKCLDRPFKCPTCTDTVQLSIWFDDECDMATVKATEKLVNDLGEIFKSGNHSDVIIKIKDEEFHLHKNILANRSPYFSSMFKADMKEKNTGIVTIDDCDVDVFRNYALFIYTGKVDEMTDGNVCDLYEVADKYQEDQLRKECLWFMKTKMSVECFYDFIIVALKHDDNELLLNATDFFCRQTKEIIQSVKWESFMIEYPTQANKLYLKAYDGKCK